MFKNSLEIGRFGEVYTQKLLRNAGLPTKLNEDRSRERLIEWDIESELGGRPFRIEVKFDQMEQKTGNVAVEFYNVKLGKPSGIDATVADLWVFVFQGMSAFVARTADLRSFCKTVKPFRHIPCGGDNNAALMLYSRDVILPAVFHPMDDLNPEELKGLLSGLLGIGG